MSAKYAITEGENMKRQLFTLFGLLATPSAYLNQETKRIGGNMKANLPYRKDARAGAGVLFCTVVAVTLAALPCAAQNWFSQIASSHDGGGVEHVFYVGVDQHIHELAYTPSSLIEVDLINATRASVLPVVSLPIANLNVANTSTTCSAPPCTAREDVFYVGTNGHIYQISGIPGNCCRYPGDDGYNWFWVDLTAAAGGPTNFGSVLAASSDTGGEHVYYLGSDAHLHQLYWNNTTWVNQDLTLLSGGSTPGPAQGLTGFSDAAGEHVLYLNTTTGHIYQLFNSLNSNNWSNWDLTALSNGALDWGLSLAALGNSSSEPVPYVYYLGPNYNIYQLFKSFSCFYRFCFVEWVDQDLTSATGTPAANGWTSISSSATLPARVFYSGGSGDVHQLSSTSGYWTDQNLTLSAGGAPASASTCGKLPLTSTQDQGGEHVYYVGWNSHIYQLLSTNGTTWGSIDLTMGAGAPNNFAESCLIE
jgi:hypothetical protein